MNVFNRSFKCNKKNSKCNFWVQLFCVQNQDILFLQKFIYTHAGQVRFFLFNPFKNNVTSFAWFFIVVIIYRSLLVFILKILMLYLFKMPLFNVIWLWLYDKSIIFQCWSFYQICETLIKKTINIFMRSKSSALLPRLVIIYSYYTIIS